MDQRTRRSPARFLAPLALIAVVIAFLVIVTSSGGGGAGSATSDSATTPAAKTTTTSTAKKTRSRSRKKPAKQGRGKTYTVQVGDTLGAIATKTGVPLQRIEELNPDVDPHAMTAGQEIRLK
jgi:LysM repeat protein